MPEFVMETDSTGYAKIKVIGVGGGGCNAVDWMFDTGLQNVEFFCLNTDAQALKRYKCPNKIQIGTATSKGRGCGGSPEVGEKCMEEERATVEEMLQGADIVFVTAGLGGGTGTGGAPVVASVARSLGILTVAVVSRPFRFEGPRRMATADRGLEKLRKDCDTIITVSNDRLLEVAGQKATLREAFAVANNVLSQAVQSISDLVTIPGLINVDFNDIRAVMGDRGGAVMGIGVGKGENRASEAVKKATSSPLLDKIVIDGATGVLVSITGGPDMTLGHVNEAMSLIYESVDNNAEIIFGAVVDESVHDEMRVILIATGFPDDPHRLVAAESKRLEAKPAAAPVSSDPFGSWGLGNQLQTAQPTILAAAGASPMVPTNGGATTEHRHAAPQPTAFTRPAPAAEPPAPPAPAPQRTAAPGNLRHAIDELREEIAPAVPQHAAPSGFQQRAMPQAAPVRPAAMPAPAPVVRPAQPVRAPGGNGDGAFNKTVPEYNKVKDNQETPNIPMFNPTAQTEAQAEPAAVKTDDYEIPAFLRRRRSALFD